MTTQTLKCERHGELTRLACVDCGKPVCPKCAVRTDAGLKCEADAEVVEAPKAAPEPEVGRSRRPLYLGIAGASVALVLIVVVLVLDARDTSPGVAPIRPAIGSWAEAPALATIRGSTTAVVLDDGKVLVAGGGVGAIPIAASELFDPVTNSWSSTGDLVRARRGHRAVVLSDGRVLVAGGRNTEGDPTPEVEIFDVDLEVWESVEPMSVGRIGHSMTLLSDGRVLVAGGTAPLGPGGAGGGQTIRPDATAEIYDPVTREWSPTRAMSTPRFEHSATLLADGKVLIAGGQGPDDGGRITALASTELFDPPAGGFVSSTPLSEGRANHSAVRLVDQSILVVGGAGGDNADIGLSSVELFEPRTGTWTTLDSLSTARTGHTVTLLPDGRALVVGGEARRGGSRASLDEAEIYDPQGQEWRSAGEMGCPRSEHAAVLLGDATVLVMAGDTAFPGQTPIAQGCVDRFKP